MPKRRMAPGPNTPIRNITPADVSEAFKSAWPGAVADFRGEDHYCIAELVNEWVYRTNARKGGRPAEEAIRSAHSNYLAMHKHARAFLRAAPAVIADLQSRRLIVSRPPGTENIPPEIWRKIAPVDDLDPGLTKALAAIEAAKVALEAVPDRDPARWEDRSSIKVIADATIRLWLRVKPDADIGRGVDSPLVTFVRCLLNKAGFAVSGELVSDYLRGRENRPRSGKRNPAK